MVSNEAPGQLEHEITRVRLNKDKDEVTLVPSNPSYDPITTKASNIKIECKVLGLLRSFNT